MGECSSSSTTRPTPQPQRKDRSAKGAPVPNLGSDDGPGKCEIEYVNAQLLYDPNPGEVVVNEKNFSFLTTSGKELEAAEKVTVAFDLDDEKLRKILSPSKYAKTLDFKLSGSEVTKVEATSHCELEKAVGLSESKMLQTLNLKRTKVGNDAMMDSETLGRGLKCLTLDGCDRIKSFGILAPLSNLEELHMSTCKGIGRGGGSETLINFRCLDGLIADHTVINDDVKNKLRDKLGSNFSSEQD
ncbi:hypothetical protein ERJ75_001034700 [Trypanosoma vivax]|nr:hypothetical protein ERJ75_001034700 [Trypanosoma vivax]